MKVKFETGPKEEKSAFIGVGIDWGNKEFFIAFWRWAIFFGYGE